MNWIVEWNVCESDMVLYHKLHKTLPGRIDVQDQQQKSAYIVDTHRDYARNCNDVKKRRRASC
jgi:hypothetical protein